MIAMGAVSISFEHYHINESSPKKGVLIYGFGDTIYQLNLSNKQRKILYHMQYASIGQLSKIDQDHFLFSLNLDNDYIAIFNRKTGQVKKLRQGGESIYMPKYKKILFNYSPSFSVGPGLYETDMADLVHTARRVSGSVSMVGNYKLIPISDDEVVLQTSGSPPPTAWSYNLKTQQFKAFSNNCYPSVWLQGKNKLLCGSTEGYRFLTDLKMSYIKKLPLNHSELVDLYIPSSNTLILSVTAFRMGEVSDLWFYNLTTGKKGLIMKNNGFGPEDGIYYSN